MRRVVLDVNVYVSALLAPTGSPAQILESWAGDQVDVIVSPLLLAELERVLRRRKFRRSIPVVQVDALLSALAEDGIAFADPRHSQARRPTQAMTTSWPSRVQPTPTASSPVIRTSQR